MKTNLSALLCLLLLFPAACSRSPQEKAVAAIVHHLEKTLKDPSSYIPVQYDIEELVEPRAHLLASDSAGAVVANRDSPDPAVTRSVSGWKIIHKFKCRSESGMVKDTQLTFFVTSNYNIKNIR